MDIIIKKFNLPEDIQNEIYNYCYDRQGYTYEEIQTINKLRKNNNFYILKVNLYVSHILGFKKKWMQMVQNAIDEIYDIN